MIWPYSLCAIVFVSFQCAAVFIFYISRQNEKEIVFLNILCSLQLFSPALKLSIMIFMLEMNNFIRIQNFTFDD